MCSAQADVDSSAIKSCDINEKKKKTENIKHKGLTTTVQKSGAVVC